MKPLFPTKSYIQGIKTAGAISWKVIHAHSAFLKNEYIDAFLLVRSLKLKLSISLILLKYGETGIFNVGEKAEKASKLTVIIRLRE